MTGTGTAEDPYIIMNAQDLQDMNLDLTAHYKLGQNILGYVTRTWNGGAGFDPVGDAANQFTGVLNGNGHVISGLYINRPTEDYVGLFGMIDYPAQLDHVIMIGLEFTGKDYVGGIAGYVGNTATLKSNILALTCQAYGTLSGGSYIGGMFGYSKNLQVSTSWCQVNITSGTSYLGGFAGYLDYNFIINVCNAKGSIASGSQYVGGFVGKAGRAGYEASYIYNSLAVGSVTADSILGGFAGDYSYAAARLCGAGGDVNGADSTMGGFAGSLTNSSVTCSFAQGDVLSTSAVAGTRAGGFAGVIDSASTVNCYAWGDVTSTDMTEVGGYVGQTANSALIVNCYSLGAPSGGGNVGGFCGANTSGTITSCYWNTELSGTAVSDGGTGLTTAEMYLESSYVGWDFS